MEIFPAIDLSGGKVVRLLQGDYDKMTIYGDDATAVAAGFSACGARNLHLVDLDGAREGSPVNYMLIRDLVAESGMFAEVGGGIRNEKQIFDYLNLGVQRVILGTAALQDQEFLLQMAEKYGDKIAVGVDSRDGMVAIRGWLEISAVPALEFCRKIRDMGIKTVIFTDISKDGMQGGANLELYRELLKIEGLDIIASGGISFEQEISDLAHMGIKGAVVGRAIYTGLLDLSRIIKIADGRE